MAYASGALGAIFGCSMQKNLISWEKKSFEKGERFFSRNIPYALCTPAISSTNICFKPSKDKVQNVKFD